MVGDLRPGSGSDTTVNSSLILPEYCHRGPISRDTDTNTEEIVGLVDHGSRALLLRLLVLSPTYTRSTRGLVRRTGASDPDTSPTLCMALMEQSHCRRAAQAQQALIRDSAELSGDS